jgi:hypothetical protein
MMLPSPFTVTEDHLKLLRRMFVGWDNCETGAPCIDPKRPYGNSDVETDIVEILGWPIKDPDEGPTDKQKEKASKLHKETQAALQITLVIGKFEAGTYRRTELYNDRSWAKVE